MSTSIKNAFIKSYGKKKKKTPARPGKTKTTKPNRKKTT
jgi:hypothetical protein